MKRFTINFSLPLALGLGVVTTLALLWLLSGASPTAQAQGPDGESLYYVHPTCSGVPTPTLCYTSVQAAVDAADDPDDLIKVAAGTYTGVQVRAGVTQVVYINKTVIIQGGYDADFNEPPEPDVNLTTLDAQGEGRVLYITGDITPTIQGLRITGGDAGVMNNGGGVYVINASVTFSDNHVFSNIATSYGGGLYLNRSDATLNGNTISTNTASSYGGGLYLFYSSDATLENNFVLSNSADVNGGGLYLFSNQGLFNDNVINDNVAERGGGLYLVSSGATFNGNTVNDNVAERGGGLYLSSSEAALDGNTIKGNSAQGSGSTLNGGGLYLNGSDATLNGNQIISNSAATSGGGLYLYGSDVTFRGNEIISNTASDSGGGLYMIYESAPTLINDVVADNQAGIAGSGLYVIGSSPTLFHSTIAHNVGGDGSGVYVIERLSTYSTVALTNTILVSHSVGIQVAAGNTVILEATLWGDGLWANENDWGGAGDIITGTPGNNHWGDPAFLNPRVGDYRIGSSSAAREVGVDAGVTDDIEGDLRPSDWQFDVGVDEYGSALVIHKTAWPPYLYNGETVTYTLTITSAGSEPATDVHLTDTLPFPQIMESIDSTPSLSCTLSTDWGGSSICDLSTLASRETVRITLTARMTTEVPDETSWRMRNTARVKAAETPSRTASISTIRVYCRARLDSDPTEYDTVQAAVDAALPDDEVWVSGYCAYVAPRDAITQTVYLSKTLAVRGGCNLAFDTWDVSAYPTTLDARGWGRVFYIAGNTTPTIEGLRIVNGDAAGLGGAIIPSQDAGGGVYIIDATPTLSNVQVFSSVARYGGGLYLERSTATLENSTVNGNAAESNGGGLYLYYSDATLNGNTINDNDGPYGGGLHLRVSNATLDDNTINDNTARYGGGLYLNKSDAVLKDSTVNGNTVMYNGGGLHLTGSDATLDRNTINANEAQYGGGLYLISSDVVLCDSDVNDNVAVRRGGGLYMVNSHSTLDTNTINGNDAQHGGGLYLSGSGRTTLNANWVTANTVSGSGGGLYLNKSDVELTNNVVADNQADIGDGLYIAYSSPRLMHTTIARNGETGLDVRDDSIVELVNTILVSHSVGIQTNSGTTVTLEATLWGTGVWVNDDDWAGAGMVDNTMDYWEDPGFIPGDYHITTGSAPIDAGVDAGVLTDIDGNPRPADAGYEIGADEHGLSLLLHKSVWPRYPVKGDWLTYTLVVTAAGSVTIPATNIQLTDTLPAPQRMIGVTPSQGTCSHSTDWGGGVSCELGGLNVGEAIHITLTAQLTDTFFDPPVWRMRNAAWVTSTETTSYTAYAETTWVYCRARINDEPTTYESVQAAVDAAFVGDVVKIAGYCAPADPVPQVVYLDKSITLQGGWHLSFTQRNLTNYPTTLDGRGARRVLHVSGDVAPTLQGLHITGGDAAGLGGGLAGEDAGGGMYVVSATADIQASWIVANSADVGGGLYLSGSDATLTNNVIADNRASNAGSGLYISGASPRLLHTTIANNRGDESGVHVANDGPTYSFPALTNTILAYHSVGISVTDGSAVSLESTLRHQNSTPWGGAVNDNQTLDGDPAFANPGAGDYHVGLASAALDMGLDVGLTTDIDGQPRPLDDGCEIGADESGILVAKWDDPDPVWAGTQLTYGISITNMSPGLLTAAITDVLPAQVSTAQAHAWSPVNIAPGAVWARTVVVTVEADYGGTLTNVLQVTSDQGPAGVYTETTLSLAASLSVTKQADPAVVHSGEPLTYTLRLTNTGNADLQAAITDSLPSYVTTTQPLVWSPVNLAPGGVWEQTLVGLVDVDYQGLLTNVVRVTTEQGATGAYTETSAAILSPPGVPILLSPPDGYITTTPAITLSWQQGAGATPSGYDLELDGAVIAPTGAAWPATLPVGVHPWRVRAYNAAGYSDWSLGWTVEITEILPPPGVPTLLAPPHGAITSAPVITFSWAEGAGAPAAGYRIRLDDVRTVASATAWPTGPLSLGIHTWTVQAYNDGGDSDWAAPWTLEIVTGPGAPILLAPSDGLITTTQDVVLSWQPGAGPVPTGYNLDLDGTVVTTTGTTWPASLSLGLHTWRVRAFESVNTSDWSLPWTVEITSALSPPGVPTLLAPPNDTVTTTRSIVFAWQAGAGATPTGYNLDLNGVIITPTGAAWSANLLPGMHTWQVRARNDAVHSDWTAPWTVEVVNNAPYTPTNPNPGHLAEAVPMTQTLGWEGGDPDGDPVTYTVALGDISPPPLASSGVTTTHHNPGALDHETTYYWRIIADDGYDVSAGPIWQFTTAEPGQRPVYLPLILKSGP